MLRDTAPSQKMQGLNFHETISKLSLRQKKKLADKWTNRSTKKRIDRQMDVNNPKLCTCIYARFGDLA